MKKSYQSSTLAKFNDYKLIIFVLLKLYFKYVIIFFIIANSVNLLSDTYFLNKICLTDFVPYISANQILFIETIIFIMSLLCIYIYKFLEIIYENKNIVKYILYFNLLYLH